MVARGLIPEYYTIYFAYIYLKQFAAGLPVLVEGCTSMLKMTFSAVAYCAVFSLYAAGPIGPDFTCIYSHAFL